MFRTMMRAKLHRATLTGANLNYVGSLSLDRDLMEQLDILENEEVHVLNLNNGSRLVTYAIPAERKSGTVALNGAAARLGHAGDKVIVVTYALLRDEDVRTHSPKVALVNASNEIVELLHETAIHANRFAPTLKSIAD